jgi:sugar transferase (PEP-CTERM/EpsH1 system associated)
MLLDLVDVDSAKWAEYADQHAWPRSWLYRREGDCLLDLERIAVAAAKQSFLVTAKEVALFNRLAPELTGRVRPLGNGVDTVYFAPDAALQSPFPTGDLPLVFTGAMDYWPNIDAVTWFVQQALPLLRQQWPALRLHIVGRSPTAAVTALAGDGVAVSGTVADVRPYLQHAAVVVAPLRLARGVQNKVLEAMAMARPVVAASSCVDAIDASPGKELLAAQDVADYVRHIASLLQEPQRALAMGRAARERVIAVYSWSAQLSALDRYLEDAEVAQPQPEVRTDMKAAV